jgi:hypothetical protein
VTTAAAGGHVDSTGQPLLPPAVIWREIEADMDQWIKLCSIAFLINPTPLVAAGSTQFVSTECWAASLLHHLLT